jgi:hypothetical protein
MIFDRDYFGPQAATEADLGYAGSRFSEVRSALFANAYYRTWGLAGQPPLPVYEVNLGRALHGILPWFEKGWRFQEAARRSVASRADLRWGPDARGFRRILHPNGVCLTGTWEIDSTHEGTGYTGYFREGSRALIVGRYSTCCTETRGGRYRSLGLVGKLYPTTDPDHTEPLQTANFITQDDIGGNKTQSIDEVELRNAPDVTPWRRGLALPVLFVTALVLRRADRMTTIRQLYPVAELGKPADQPTRAPEFLRLTVERDAAIAVDGSIDFREEILARIYDPGDDEPKRTLTFAIEVSDEGQTRELLLTRRKFRNWKRIGRIVFNEAVASYNGDFVVHFAHPPWRENRNKPSSETGP